MLLTPHRARYFEYCWRSKTYFAPFSPFSDVLTSHSERSGFATAAPSGLCATVDEEQITKLSVRTRDNIEINISTFACDLLPFGSDAKFVTFNHVMTFSASAQFHLSLEDGFVLSATLVLP
jgi:hypothetical protein